MGPPGASLQILTVKEPFGAKNAVQISALSAQKPSTKFVGAWGMFAPAFKIFYQGWKAATEAFQGHYLVISNQDRRSRPK